jgi:FeS assembly SUF system protein
MNDLTQAEAEILRDKVIGEIRKVFDPEIPVNLYDLGLVYRIDIQRGAEKDECDIVIDMTLTSPACPIAEELPNRVRYAVLVLPEAGEVTVNLVWDPPWDPSRMTDEARLALNMF